MGKAHYHPKTRRMKLDIDTLETLDDVKKILHLMDIRIDTDNPLWEEVGEHFTKECVPKGYMKLIRKVGHEGIAKLHYHEMEIEIKKLLDEEKNV